MNIRAFLSSFLSTFFGGLVLAILLFVPAVHALMFLISVPLWLIAALRSMAGGAPMPDFWSF